MTTNYFKFHALIIITLIRKLFLLFDKRIFCFTANLFFLLRGFSVRFKYQNDGFYSAREDDIKIFFKNKVQAFNVYDRGLLNRAKSIGETYFLDKINFKKGDRVIDCGANVGDLYLYFSTYLKADISYLGIEPSPEEYSALLKNVGDNNAKNIGLWDSISTLKFYISSDGADSSLIEPRIYTSIINVETQRLDSFYNEKVKLLKIEAEGAEPEVLKGSLGLLKNVEYISADLGFERGLDQLSTLVPVVNFLFEHDFELIEISHNRICALFKNTKI